MDPYSKKTLRPEDPNGVPTKRQVDQDDVPTKRQSGTMWVIKDLATDTAAKLTAWSDPRLLVDDMTLRHAALAAKSIAEDCRHCISQIEMWLADPPGEEERKALVDRVLTLRDHAQDLLEPFDVML